MQLTAQIQPSGGQGGILAGTSYVAKRFQGVLQRRKKKKKKILTTG